MKRILVAEDDAFLNSAYRIKLTKAGFEVQLARDGKEVLEILKNFLPDLIILDLVMPVMDGFAALAAIKQQAVFAKIPVIVASNLGQSDEIARAKALGATDFMIKSDLSLDVLIQKIHGIVGS